MQSLNIVFSRSSNLFAAAIRAYPPSGPFSHCAFYLPEEDRFIDCLASKKGVVYTPKNEFVIRSSVIKQMVLPVPDRKSAVEWAHNTVGSKYDWSYIFGTPFRKRNWQDSDKYVCSEHCAILTKKAGLDIISPSLHNLTPNHLYSILYAAGAREVNYL